MTRVSQLGNHGRLEVAAAAVQHRMVFRCRVRFAMFIHSHQYKIIIVIPTACPWHLQYATRSVPTPVLCGAWHYCLAYSLVLVQYCFPRRPSPTRALYLQLPTGVELNTPNGDSSRRRLVECGEAKLLATGQGTPAVLRPRPTKMGSVRLRWRFFTSAEIDDRQTGTIGHVSWGLRTGA